MVTNEEVEGLGDKELIDEFLERAERLPNQAAIGRVAGVKQQTVSEWIRGNGRSLRSSNRRSLEVAVSYAREHGRLPTPSYVRQATQAIEAETAEPRVAERAAVPILPGDEWVRLVIEAALNGTGDKVEGLARAAELARAEAARLEATAAILEAQAADRRAQAADRRARTLTSEDANPPAIGVTALSEADRVRLEAVRQAFRDVVHEVVAPGQRASGQ